MKKLINFNRVDEIQALANKRYGGNFSLAVNSVMSLALDSADFWSGDDNSVKQISSEKISHKDILEFAAYIESEHAKLANFPDRFLDAVMIGVDASMFNDRLKSLFTCDSDEDLRCAAKEIFESRQITENCQYIKDASELAAVWLTYKGNDRNPRSEAKYHQAIVSNFKDYFQEYTLAGSEVTTDDGADRIDILAKCDKTGRDVIIELKIGGKSAHKQLRSYAFEFENPILINVSEDDVKNKRDGITYLTYKDIGVSLD